MKRVLRVAVMVGLFLALVAGLPGELTDRGLAQAPERPNVVVIMTDDQRAEDLAHMPNVQRLLVEEGTTFKNFTIALPTCCPSRASFLRGQYAHNHRVGFSAGTADYFANSGKHSSTVATWLDGAGYRTGQVGKYLNGFSMRRNTPPGWDRFYANLDRDVWSRCFNSDAREKCKRKGNIDAHLAGVAEGFVKSSGGGGGPFFLWFSPNAPHQFGNGPPPAPEAALSRLAEKPMPRGPAFNEADVSDKPSWIRNEPRLGKRRVESMTREYRARLTSLQVVDHAVGRLVATLEERGELDNTYLLFTTDNGYHMGEHRLAQGKMTPYLTDVRFPLIVRGPGVPEGATRDEMVQNVDLAPTIAELANAKVPGFVDGRSMAPLLRGKPTNWRNAAFFEGAGRHPFTGITTEGGLHYVEYGSGARELYDLNVDPHQLENLLGPGSPQDPRAPKLAAKLAGLRSCAAETCRRAQKP